MFESYDPRRSLMIPTVSPRASIPPFEKLSNEGSSSMRKFNLCQFPKLNTGFDDCSSHVKTERCSRSLTLRMHRNSLQDMLTNIHIDTSHEVNHCRRHSDHKNLDLDHLLDPELCTRYVSSNELNLISSLFHEIISSCTKAPESLDSICTSSEFLSALANSLSNDNNDSIVLYAMQTISSLFPLIYQNNINSNPDLIDEFIDDGIALYLSNILESTNPLFIASAVHLIYVLCEYSTYAIDAIMCLNLHLSLIDIAKNEVYKQEDCNFSIVNGSCQALQKLFEKSESIETQYLNDIIKPLIELILSIIVHFGYKNRIDCELNIENIEIIIHGADLSCLDEKVKHSLEEVILCLVYITNIQPSLIYLLYKCNILPIIAAFLLDENLRSSAIMITGNMSIANQSNIELLVNSGIVNLLIGAIDSPNSSDAFWALSNLIEAAPTIMIPGISHELFMHIFNMMPHASYEVMKEGVYFICTYIIFLNKDQLYQYITPEMIDLITGMLACDVTYILLRCLDLLILFIHHHHTNQDHQFMEFLEESDATDRLSELVDKNEMMISERASFILNYIDYVCYHNDL